MRFKKKQVFCRTDLIFPSSSGSNPFMAISTKSGSSFSPNFTNMFLNTAISAFPQFSLSHSDWSNKRLIWNDQ